MPPRHAYWTILVGDAPTAFRAADRADLVPTFERLRHTHPEVVLKWFARGRLWESPEAQRAAERAPRPRGDQERRGPEWRPGGTHRDPRDRFKPKPRDQRERNRAGRVHPADRDAAGQPPPHQARPPNPAWRPDRKFSGRPTTLGKPSGRSFSKPPAERFDQRAGRGDRKPFGTPRGKPPGKPSGTPSFDKAQGPPFDKAHGKRFDRPHGGSLKNERRFDRRPPQSRSFGKPPGDRPPFTGHKAPRPPQDVPPSPTGARPKEEDRVEASRKHGTRLVKKFKR